MHQDLHYGVKKYEKQVIQNSSLVLPIIPNLLSYALEMANQMGLNTPGSTTINNLFSKAIDEGYGDLYFPVIKKIL